MADRPRWVRVLQALGRHSPPAAVKIEGRPHALQTVFKHDFFAATALYHGPSGLVVVKTGRRADFLGLPLGWLGRLATVHECAMYRRLAGIDGIPRLVGRLGPDMFAHAFVPGRPLQRGQAVSSEFFPQLQALLKEIHQRDVAYIDLEKRENILVGEGGRPYLIDFQISLHVPPGGGLLRRSGRWFLRRLQQSDRYHLLKHWRRMRPDQLTADEIRQSRRRPIWIELHRRVARPFVRFRQQTLRRVT